MLMLISSLNDEEKKFELNSGIWQKENDAEVEAERKRQKEEEEGRGRGSKYVRKQNRDDYETLQRFTCDPFISNTMPRIYQLSLEQMTC